MHSAAGPDKGRGKKKSGSGKLPGAVVGDARDEVAGQLGVSGRTYEKRKAVAEAAEAEPEKYGKLLADMERTGRVDGPTCARALGRLPHRQLISEETLAKDLPGNPCISMMASLSPIEPGAYPGKAG